LKTTVRDEIYREWERIVFDLRSKEAPFVPTDEAYSEYRRVSGLYLEGGKDLELSGDEANLLLSVGWGHSMHQQDYAGALRFVEWMRGHPKFADVDPTCVDQWVMHASYSYILLGKEEEAIDELEPLVLEYRRGYDSYLYGVTTYFERQKKANPRLLSLALHVLKRKRARKSVVDWLNRDDITNDDIFLALGEIRKKV
jgi:hypothetical protein